MAVLGEPEILVASYGGSGTNLLADWLELFRRVKTPEWHRSLCHAIRGVELTHIPRVVLLGDPVLAWQSMRRRGGGSFLAAQANKILGRPGEIVEAMTAFFDAWTTAGPPLVLVKYEALWQHLGAMATALGIPFDRFPPQRPRQSKEPEDTPAQLLALRDRWRALPDFQIR